MKTPRDYRDLALAALKGNWTPAVLLTLAVGAISSISSLFGALSLPVIICVTFPLAVGVYAVFRMLYLRTNVDLVKYPFTEAFSSKWTHYTGGMALMFVYTFLWTLLLIVPGLIKSMSYALTPYILQDKPELKPKEAIKLSEKMMDGHKMELFVLYLPFIGLYILSALTLFIGALWITPIFYTAVAAYYEDRKAEYEAGKEFETEKI